jgi:lipid-binding SYLF domain-containing protein
MLPELAFVQEILMNKPIRSLILAAAAAMTLNVVAARAETASELTASSKRALRQLVSQNPTAKALNDKAKGVLVFPSIVKAGFMFGGQMGDGTLLKRGRAVAFYNTVAASYGLQAGVQVYGYALFFMDEGSMGYLDSVDGFEIGVGPSVVVVDQGMGKNMNTTTIQNGIYAFIFDQKGLMGGLGIQGSKITKIDK